jgi:hypothetical protein
MAGEAHRRRVEDAARPAIVHVPSHSRHRQKVVTVMTLANVSTILPLQNGHMVGRVTAVLNCDSDILAIAPSGFCLPTASAKATAVRRAAATNLA